MHKRIALLLAAAISISWIASILSQDVGGSGENRNLDLPYNADTSAVTEEAAAEIIFFYGQQFQGDAFVFCVDRSGSMGDHGELARAKREICRNIMEFSPETEFAVCFFDTGWRMWPGTQRTVKATIQNKQAAVRWVGFRQGGSMSCPKPALLKSLQTLNSSKGRRRCLIYVGDGGGTCMGQGWRTRFPDIPAITASMRFEEEYLAETLTEVRRMNYKRASINTIGVMMNGRLNRHHNFVRLLAQQNNGRYRRID